jgi:hypothetical protein
MTSTKTLPPHGTYARANGSPGRRPACHCEPCRTTRNRIKKRNKVNRELGRAAMVNATSARAHLALLRQTMTWPQIADRTSCEEGHLREIAVGKVPTIRRTTLNKVLATKPEPPAPGKFVDATGTIRRVRALRAVGYSATNIATSFGFAETHVRQISRGTQPTVRQRIADKIAAVYAEISNLPVPIGAGATMSRNYAAAQGWAPPGAWDDIDDPNSTPDTTVIELNFHERAELRREEIIHFAWCGHTPEQILDRLNGEVSISTVRAVVHEWRTGEKRDRKQVAA